MLHCATHSKFNTLTVKMLMFVVWCWVAFIDLNGVVADTTIDTCNSGDELHQKMDWVSSSLKLKAPYSNQKWSTAFQTLQDSKFVTPPEFSEKLKNLIDAATDYNDLLSQFHVNATTAEANSTYNRLFSDYKMVNYIDCDPSYFKSTILAIACGLVDQAQKIAGIYTDKTDESFNQLKLTLLPHNSEIIEKMNGLLTILKSGTNIDYGAVAINVTELTQLIQNDTAHLRDNVDAELVKYGTVVDGFACDAETEMQKPAQTLYSWLPIECHLTLQPACDSPTHLLRRALGMFDDLNNAQLTVDSVPTHMARELKLLNNSTMTPSTNQSIDDMVANSLMQSKNATDGNVLPKFEFVHVVEEHPVELGNTIALSLACELCDAGRNITAAYKLSVSHLAQSMLEPEKWNGTPESLVKKRNATDEATAAKEVMNALEVGVGDVHEVELDKKNDENKPEVKLNEAAIVTAIAGDDAVVSVEEKDDGTIGVPEGKDKVKELVADDRREEKLQKSTIEQPVIIDHLLAIGEQLKAFKNQQIEMAKKVIADMQPLTDKLKAIVSSHIFIHDE